MTTIWASSGVTKEAKPFVTIHWVDQAGQLSPDEARAFAMRIIAAADAADFDSTFMKTWLDLASGDTEGAYGILVSMREARGDSSRSGGAAAKLQPWEGKE